MHLKMLGDDDIIYTETDGIYKNKLTFSKSIDEPDIVNLRPSKKNRSITSFIYSLFEDIFLSEGFPNSVHILCTLSTMEHYSDFC